MKIKSIFCLVIFTGIFSSLSYAQQEQRFEAGLLLGFNMSQIDGDLLHGFNKLGLNTGIRAYARLDDRWKLSLDLLFMQQGSSRARFDDPASTFDKIALNFVEAPVLVHFTDWKIQATAGFSYGRLMNYEITSFDGTDATDSYDLDPSIFSLVLGATYFFEDNLGINIHWSKWINNPLRSSSTGVIGEGGKFIGRTITIRGIYLL
ncbi:MAG TPA: outer membrane beta-barrel protein [Saprospiraceae bacterium]|nr:outer membrane beta-barrel protein [Saprospiraceae bacterium]HMQ81929.1 outer membrane beta-barrel protein [Saprospiraceae bacterium]